MGEGTQPAFLKVELEKLTFVFRLRGNRLLSAMPLIVLGRVIGYRAELQGGGRRV